MNRSVRAGWSPALPLRASIAVLASSLALALLVLAAPAGAAVTGLTLDVAPSSLQAGGAPNVKIAAGFQYDGSSDDLKDLFVRLPAGLVGNPSVASYCSAGQLEDDACPAGSKVGTVEVQADITFGVAIPNTAPGDVYNLFPEAGEPARLGVVVRPANPLITVPLSTIVLEAGLQLKPGPGGYALESTLADQPRTVSGLPMQIQSIALTLSGIVNGKRFMRMPTSCAPAAASAAASSYFAPGSVATANDSLNPTGCASLPFAPSLAGTVTLSGGLAVPPAVQTTLRFRDGDAALDIARVTLPPALGANAATLSRACPAASFATGTCPASSRVGTATATSPLTPIPLTGPVRLVENPGGLPLIGVDLGGVVDLRLQGTVDITADGLATTFTGAPDLPLSSFTLALDGGPGGLLLASAGLCTSQAVAGAALTAETGRTATASAALAVSGCPASGGSGSGPAGGSGGSTGTGSEPAGTSKVKGRLRAGVTLRVRRGRARLVADVRAGAGRPGLRRLTVTLPRGARFARSTSLHPAAALRLHARGRSLRALISSPKARVRVSAGGIRVSKALARKLRGRRVKLAIRITVAGGRTTVLHVRPTLVN